MTRPKIGPRSPGQLANTLFTWPIKQGLISARYQPYQNLTPEKMKWKFSQILAVSKLLYGYITWILTKRLEKKRNRNHDFVQKLEVASPPPHQKFYGHHPAGKNKCEFINDVHLWSPTHGPTSVSRPACANIGCRLENLPRVMADRDRWRERKRESEESLLSTYLDNVAQSAGAAEYTDYIFVDMTLNNLMARLQ